VMMIVALSATLGEDDCIPAACADFCGRIIRM
jgi:hypothetical protein